MDLGEQWASRASRQKGKKKAIKERKKKKNARYSGSRVPARRNIIKKGKEKAMRGFHFSDPRRGRNPRLLIKGQTPEKGGKKKGPASPI